MALPAGIEEPVWPDGGRADEVRPYRIHASSKYLALTKNKLEIVRLPHELDRPKPTDCWPSKSQIEPLIDFWLGSYQWRDQEEVLNDIPQFRTAFVVSQSKSAVKIHFIHDRSSSANAIPLLIIPPFPFSNLCLAHLIELFTEPGADHQSFHLVIPSLPGVGFSHSLPANTDAIPATAAIFDSLMKRLGYPFYLATNAGAGSSSPAQIDYRLADWLSTRYPESCLGTHLISPPLTAPGLQEAPLEWAKWSIANKFKASVWGYRSVDLSAFKQSRRTTSSNKASGAHTKAGSSTPKPAEPNVLSYALCDSPTGLLVLVMAGLRFLAPNKEFTPTEIINFTHTAWLPGPEGAMNFWAYCSNHTEKSLVKSPVKPRVVLTVFLGNDEPAITGGGSRADVDAAGGGDVFDSSPYSCPAWAKTRYDLLRTFRTSGKPGLLAWERPEIIANGVRGLAAAVLRVDSRLARSLEPMSEPVPSGQQVVASVGTVPPGKEEEEGGPQPPMSEWPDSQPKPSPKASGQPSPVKKATGHVNGVGNVRVTTSPVTPEASETPVLLQSTGPGLVATAGTS
ncbi:putative epoxide hydrolase [Rosellinia necatrix]|uniref:Putative epoxide hydrolase n=1 Tax=Rosellinia necatrix TaxID=77044 RepID=A0A1S7ULF4_ROSNE|nr:putative epoxide hydrolase [Rosellinia necatrix]